MDAGEQPGPHCEGRFFHAGGVESQQGRQEDVEEDRAGPRVWLGALRRRLGDGQAAVQAVREVAGPPPLEDEAVAEDRAEVWEGRELRGGARVEHESGEGEAEVYAPLDRGGGEEVRVDLGLGVVVVGETGVELGYSPAELGVAGDELGVRGQGEVLALPLGGIPASARGFKVKFELFKKQRRVANSYNNSCHSHRSTWENIATVYNS